MCQFTVALLICLANLAAFVCASAAPEVKWVVIICIVMYLRVFKLLFVLPAVWLHKA